MTLNAQWSVGSNAAALNARTARLAGGYLRIYNGAQPADTTVAVTTQTLLAELRYGTPAFAPTTTNVASANPIAAATGLATGTATWCRRLQADGVTVEVDGSAGTVEGQFNLVLNSAAIQQGADIVVSSDTITAPQAGG